MMDVFEREGLLVRPEGNMPLLLMNGGRVWMVRAGRVDVFGVLMQNGEPAGPRVHLFRAGPAQLLFNAGSPGNVVLLAAGPPGCELLGLELKRFRELVCTDAGTASFVEDALDAWVRGLSTGVRSGVSPKSLQYLEAGKETSVAQGVEICVDSNILWVAQLDGDSCFMGKAELPGIGPADVFPLCSQAWLRSLGKATYSSKETGACLLDGSVWPALDLFHGQILKLIELNRREYEADERRRLDEKAVNERAAFENSLRRLSSVLGADLPPPALGGGLHEALMSACRMIGEKQGIGFEAPSQEEISAHADPLDAIIHCSRVRKRLVVLKGDWWNRDVGPLLGFTEEDRRPVAILPAGGGYEIDDAATGRRIWASPQTVLDSALLPSCFTDLCRNAFSKAGTCSKSDFTGAERISGSFL